MKRNTSSINKLTIRRDRIIIRIALEQSFDYILLIREYRMMDKLEEITFYENNNLNVSALFVFLDAPDIITITVLLRLKIHVLF